MIVYRPLGPVTVGQAWGIGLLLLVVWFWTREVSGGGSPGTLTVPVIVLSLYGILALSRGDVALGLNGLAKFASWALLVPTIERIVERGGEPLMIGAARFASLSSIAAMSVAIALDKYGKAYYRGDDLGWTQGPHGIASTAVMACSLVLLWAVSSKGKRLTAILSALLAVGVVMSFVRTTLLTMAIIVGAYLLVSARDRRARNVVLVLLIVLGAIVMSTEIRSMFSARVSDLRNLQAGGSAVLWAGGGRVGIWLGVLQRVSKNWHTLLLGEGSGSSFDAVRLAMGTSVWAHNDFLEMLSTGGLLMLTAYVALLAWIGKPLFRFRTLRDSETEGLRVIGAATLVAFTMMAFFNGMMWYQASVLAAIAFGWTRARVGRSLSTGRSP
ncbi:MAG: hypothetical protein QMC94_06555 [Anaerosomatales bacterium]|nr:hypothetical protein [Anaerosomatales bacterium]